MIEDRLTHAERIRLESLNQAMNITGLTSTERPTREMVIENAEFIEAWLKKAKEGVS
jgi:hypothetical protein